MGVRPRDENPLTSTNYATVDPRHQVPKDPFRGVVQINAVDGHAEAMDVQDPVEDKDRVREGWLRVTDADRPS